MTNEPHGAGAAPGVLASRTLASAFERRVPEACALNPASGCDLDVQDRRCSNCAMSQEHAALLAWQKLAATHFVRLTLREREVMEAILAGHPNKNIAADLGISQRTVENHRASIMRKTGSRSLPALSRLELAATWNFATLRSVESCSP